MVIVLPPPCFNSTPYSRSLLRPRYNAALSTPSPAKSAYADQSITQLITIFEKNMPMNVGKKLLIQALENPDIAKLVMSPSPDQLQKAARLSRAMKKYALSAQDLDNNPRVRNNIVVTIQEAARPKLQQAFAKLKATNPQTCNLLFGANYNRNAAERKRQAAAIIAVFSSVNGGVCTFAPPLVDFAAIAASSMEH